MISCFVLVQVSLALRFSLSVIEYYHLDDHPFISSWRACCHSDILQRLLRLYKLIELGRSVRSYAQCGYNVLAKF